MSASIKVLEQKQKTVAKVAQMKKALKRIDSGSLDQHKYNDYNTNKSQDSQSNDEANLSEIEDLNIGSN